MPELAEVETLCRQLAARLAGRVIEASSSRPEPRWANGRCTGAVGAVTRRSKAVVLELRAAPVQPRPSTSVEPERLVVRLGMTGTFVLHDPSDDSPIPVPYECARWDLDDASSLVLVDPRRFSSATFITGPLEALLGPRAPDPLDADFVVAATACLADRRGAVKALLLGGAVAGVGNYLADEALWRAQLDPRAACLTEAEAAHLAAHLAAFAAQCLAAGGATFRTYRSLAGPGRAQEDFAVYGRATLPCLRCGTALSATRVAGRTTVWCSHCQDPVRRPPR